MVGIRKAIQIIINFKYILKIAELAAYEEAKWIIEEYINYYIR